MTATAKIAAPISGDKLYQQRARQALPLLVRQAEAGETVYYSDLASELGMSNARTLNYPLGSIGETLERLSAKWDEKIPPLQCLVINRKDQLPGEGVGWFLIKEADFASLPKSRKQAIVKAELTRVFNYGRWREVLSDLQIPYAAKDYTSILKAASAGNGGGEGPEHEALKNYVAANPGVIGLALSTPMGETEVKLPSADTLDVSFSLGSEWVAAEVKSRISEEHDIARGLFQCVKYKAVMEAVQSARGERHAARAVLVLERKLPIGLLPLRNTLGIEVFEDVTPSPISMGVAQV